MKLIHKLTLAFAAVLLFAISAGLGGMYVLNQSIGVYEKAIHVDYPFESEVTKMHLDFKTQVQEWKNVLLRGKDAEQLNKYWAAFQKHEKDVGDAGKKLKEALPEGEIKATLEKFLAEHAKMGEGYRKGFESFKESGFDSAAGDKSVKGMDREPSALLLALSEKINANSKSITSHAKDSSKQAMILCAIFMLVVFSAGIAISLILSRSIVSRLDTANTIADAVERGDLTIEETRLHNSTKNLNQP